MHALCVLSVTQLHALYVFETDTHTSAMQTQCTLSCFSVDLNEEWHCKEDSEDLDHFQWFPVVYLEVSGK